VVSEAVVSVGSKISEITTVRVDFWQSNAIFSINLIEPVLPSLPTVVPAAIFTIVTVVTSVAFELIGSKATRSSIPRIACCLSIGADRGQRTS
jgi:hypothetical protein